MAETAMATMVEDLLRENKRLRAALKPFADAADCAERDEGDAYNLAGSSARHKLTIGDLRNAHRAYSRKGEKHDPRR